MGNCNQKSKTKKVNIFEPYTLISKKGQFFMNNDLHLRRYLLTNKYILVQIYPHIVVYELEILKLIYKTIFLHFTLLTAVKDDFFFFQLENMD